MSDAQNELPTLRGSCLCGAIAYTIRGPFRVVARCHCSMCQKVSGAEYAANATADRSGFALLRGEDRLKAYESSPGEFREFCGDCGSPLWKRKASDPDAVRIRLENLDDPFTDPVQVRVFTENAQAHTPLPNDGIPAFETLPGAKND